VTPKNKHAQPSGMPSHMALHTRSESQVLRRNAVLLAAVPPQTGLTEKTLRQVSTLTRPHTQAPGACNRLTPRARASTRGVSWS
jgi:hypothetical protein